MIPKLLKEELKKLFSHEEIEKKQIIEGCYSFIELNGEEDKALIEKLGIQVDALGPGRKAAAALGIGGEQVAQAPPLHRRRVPHQGLPLGQRGPDSPVHGAPPLALYPMPAGKVKPRGRRPRLTSPRG